MDKERTKLIIKNMELLLNQLKLEMIEDKTTLKDNYVVDSSIMDYDEIFEE